MNKRQAKERLNRIAAIWRRIEHEAAESQTKPIWDELSLKIVKAIGEGDSEYRVERFHSDPYTYARFVEAVDQSYPEISVLPDDEEAYRAGKTVQQGKRLEIELKEQELLIEAETIRELVLETPGNDAKYVDLLSGSKLHQALDAYSKAIDEEKFDQSENHVNDTGKTKKSMVKQIKTYLLPDIPLSSLDDYSSLDHYVGILRKRPITHRYKKPMAHKTARNLIGELFSFFDWLHKSPDWDWQKPVDFSEISRKPVDFEADEVRDAEDTPVYTKEQLRTLYEYATPLERLLVLLAINCAYGADQIGRLRIGEVIERNGVHYIRRIRRKKRVKGIHRLFSVTLEGIKWAIEGREEEKAAHVLINGAGNPLWRKTAGGNRCKDIPNAWYRLLDRVLQDYPKFPKHGFNTLRDTSSTMIEEIAGPEIASIHLTHKHQTSDRNLRRYSNPRRKKLFKAQRLLERRLADIFVVEDAWKERNHQQVTPKQIKRMRELREQKVPVSKIMKEVGVSHSTVYRWTENVVD